LSLVGQALSSFCPTGGGLKRVNVYLSDFGRARLAEEERLGPAELRSWKPHQGEDEDFSDMAKSTKRVITTHGRVITTRADNCNTRR
jgi:hypothetical protein